MKQNQEFNNSKDLILTTELSLLFEDEHYLSPLVSCAYSFLILTKTASQELSHIINTWKRSCLYPSIILIKKRTHKKTSYKLSNDEE